ncbi:hypothetical protein L903_25895 [Agrobacterium sp. JL28]|nr:hypothetical protein L904_25880 [Agrobacterium sp. LY4]KVK45480.1 hypothetical protein L903_25895 [Agrobacterium sp. JL28]
MTFRLAIGREIAATESAASTAENTIFFLSADGIWFSCVYVKASPYVGRYYDGA